MDLVNNLDENTWLLLHTDQEEPYYYNRAKKVTQWERPTTGQVIDLTGLVETVRESEQKNEPETTKASAASESSAGSGKEHPPSTNHNNKTPSTAGIHSDTSRPRGQSTASRRRGSVTEAEEDDKGVVYERIRQPSIAKRRHKRVWSKRNTATYGTGHGDDSGDCYYVNNETGETQWQRPDGYVSDDELEAQNVLSRIRFDLDAPLLASFEQIGLLSDEAEEERQAMAASGSLVDMGKCQDRIEQMLLLVQRVGTETEWDELIMLDDYRLARTVFSYWTEDPKFNTYVIRLSVCKLLALFSKLQPSVLSKIVSGLWGNPATFTVQVEAGISESIALDNPDKRDDALIAYAQLLGAVLTECQDYGLALDQLPSRSLIESLFDMMADSSEESFLALSEAVLALNMHTLPEDVNEPFEVAPRSDDPSELLAVMISHSKAEFFGEAILHMLNQQHFPYDNEILLKQMLKMLQTMFRYKASCEFLFTNDLLVLVDIMILELQDLPPEDAFRWEYLRLLHLVLMNSPWERSGKYRKEDIVSMLESILQAHDSGMEPRALTLVQAILTDCAETFGE